MKLTALDGRILAPALLALAIAACGDAPPPPDAEAPEVGAPAAEEPAPPTIPLTASNDSGVSGEATAMHLHDIVVVVVELEGISDAGEYAAHIHSGSCEEGGPVSAALNPVVGLADGTGASNTTLDVTEVEQDQPLFIQVHGAGGSPIACGNIEGHEF